MNNKCPLSESASWAHEHRRRLAAIKKGNFAHFLIFTFRSNDGSKDGGLFLKIIL